MVFSWKKILSGSSIFFLSFVIFTTFAVAQSDQMIPNDLSSSSASQGFDIGANANDVDVTTSPENPGAFTPTTLRISSDYIDLNRYMVRWFVDGTLVDSGIGKRTIKTTTKNYEQRTIITITIEIPSGTIQKRITLSPEDLTLLWEATDSYVPPFYQGKKLPAREAQLRIIAMPNFSTGDRSFDPSTGVYHWKRNDLIMGPAGGYGKNYFSFQHNKIRGSEKITVVASDLQNAREAQSSTTLSFYNPKVLFYEQNPTTELRSLLAKTALYFTANATTLIAEPYFFSTTKNDPRSLGFAWSMNNNPLTLIDTENPNLITLENPGGSGAANLGVAITNPKTVFQEGGGVLNIIFNKN